MYSTVLPWTSGCTDSGCAYDWGTFFFFCANLGISFGFDFSQADKLEDPDESLFVFFPEAERQSGEIKKVGVKPIHKCCQRMKDANVSKAILVVEVQNLIP